jgi:DNA repair protein RecO (recombination protein O)
MKRVNTRGIVLSRTDFGEADRILTLLTPDQGKIKGIAKGVRKSKSKMAGGIELFSVSEISYIIGKSEINTIISTRLVTHYGNIVKDLNRTAVAYEFLKTLDKATEDHPEEAYFNLLKTALESLNDESINLELIKTWFNAQLLRLGGHTPNLRTDKDNRKLNASQKYDFNFEAVCFQPSAKGRFGTDQIKFLRLLFSDNHPKSLQRVKDCAGLSLAVQPVVQALLQAHIRI